MMSGCFWVWRERGAGPEHACLHACERAGERRRQQLSVSQSVSQARPVSNALMKV